MSIYLIYIRCLYLTYYIISTPQNYHFVFPGLQDGFGRHVDRYSLYCFGNFVSGDYGVGEADEIKDKNQDSESSLSKDDSESLFYRSLHDCRHRPCSRKVDFAVQRFPVQETPNVIKHMAGDYIPSVCRRPRRMRH